MRKWHKWLPLHFLIIGALLFFVSTVCAEKEGPVKGWPRLYKTGGNRVVVHQPQLDNWDDYTLLRGKSAVSIQLKDDERMYYGAVFLQASTEADFDSRTVLFKNFKITRMTFPNLENQLAQKCRKAVMNALPESKSITISLDRILAGLERTKEQARAVAVNLKPPPIYYSKVPAVLVIFMGEPKLEAVSGIPELLYAVNTNWDILLEVGTSQYYMLNGESWLVTTDIVNGPWKAATSLPKSFARLPEDNNWKDVKKKIPGSKAAHIPRIVVSTQPAELIVTDGVPEYSPVAGTKLMYVTNTESDLFLDYGRGRFYFLTAGRWFKAQSLGGQWSSASEDLPDDFREIPSDHAKAHVLSSVPGTPDAEAAVLLASIPRKATVNRKDTTIKVVYEGGPEFVIIDGTTTVYYAVNTPYSVFRVDKKYYAVHNGVWFYSTAPVGPWIVSTDVPLVIYTIPPDHPKYNVTYVYVYDSTPDTVVVGYTSGYSGTYVASTGVVMFGYGYWIGHDDPYYHYHHYHYHSHYYAYGSAYRYDYYYGGYYSSARYYGPYGGAGGWAGYDPASGTYYRGGYSYGPYGSAFAREAYNPYTDRYGAQAGAKTPYGSWGRTVVADGDEWARAGHRSYKGKTVAGFETSKGGAAVGGYNKWTDRGAVVGKDKYGDIYVGHDGNVYKREDNDWKKNSGDGWQTVDKTAARSAAESRADSATNRKRSEYSTSNAPSFGTRSGNLNHEFKKRQTGNRRARTFEQRGFRGGGRSFRRR